MSLERDHIIWQPDDCPDPSHREAYVRVDGRTWRLHQALPGFGFQAYHHPYDGYSVYASTVDQLRKYEGVSADGV